MSSSICFGQKQSEKLQDKKWTKFITVVLNKETMEINAVDNKNSMKLKSILDSSILGHVHRKMNFYILFKGGMKDDVMSAAAKEHSWQYTC